MSAYQANRYGRTARPKAPNNQDGHYVTGAIRAALADIGAGTEEQGVYKTQNQRFMHIICSGSDSGVLNLYGYNYAAGRWSEIVTGSVGTPYGSVQCGSNQHRIVDINGVDLVAVVTGSSSKLAYGNFIAFSTF